MVFHCVTNGPGEEPRRPPTPLPPAPILPRCFIIFLLAVHDSDPQKPHPPPHLSSLPGCRGAASRLSRALRWAVTGAHCYFGGMRLSRAELGFPRCGAAAAHSSSVFNTAVTDGAPHPPRPPPYTPHHLCRSAHRGPRRTPTGKGGAAAAGGHSVVTLHCPEYG